MNKIKTINFFFFLIFIIANINFILADSFGYNSASSTVSIKTTTGNLTNFTELQDTPNSYSGQGNLCVVVNAGETALEFASCSSASGDITSVNGDTWITNGSNSGAVVLVFNATKLYSLGFWNNTWAGFNKTYADTLYSPIGSGNASWNQSLADTLYYAITNPYGYYNITNPSPTYNVTYHNYNSTGLIKDWNATINASGLVKDWNLSGLIKDWNASGLLINWSSYATGDNATWNETYARSLFKALGIETWNSTFSLFNKTYADTLYAPISVTGDNATWNQTFADGRYYHISNNVLSYWNQTFALFNKTYADTLYDPLGGSESDPLWSANQSNYYTKTNIDNNVSIWNSTYNVTYHHAWNYTQNNTFYPYSSNPLSFWNSTFALFNKTYADTLYSAIGATDTWTTNYTLYPKNVSFNSTQFTVNANISISNNVFYPFSSNPLVYFNSTFALNNQTFTDARYIQNQTTANLTQLNATTIRLNVQSGNCDLTLLHTICTNATATYIIG